MWEGIKATENLPYTSPWNILFRHQVTHNHLLLKASFSWVELARRPAWLWRLRSPRSSTRVVQLAACKSQHPTCLELPEPVVLRGCSSDLQHQHQRQCHQGTRQTWEVFCPTPSLLNQKLWEWGSGTWVFTRLSGDADAASSLRSTCGTPSPRHPGLPEVNVAYSVWLSSIQCQASKSGDICSIVSM